MSQPVLLQSCSLLGPLSERGMAGSSVDCFFNAFSLRFSDSLELGPELAIDLDKPCSESAPSTCSLSNPLTSLHSRDKSKSGTFSQLLASLLAIICHDKDSQPVASRDVET